MTPHLRFAPSPTGYLHYGNLRTAVLNYLFAKKHGGHFLLRLDDTDRERSTEEFAVQIAEDLRWLGFTWDGQAKQSDRTARYEAAAEQLKAAGRLYACFETPDELDRRRKRQLASGRPPIYDRAALKLSDEDRARLVAEGRAPHWRFRLDNSGVAGGVVPEHTNVAWDDLIRGTQTVDLGSLSDPVLIRADGTFLYTFTSVVDDIDFGITHIIRGEDHVTNTGVQVDLFKALGALPPAFAHHALLTASGDLKMSKRSGDMALMNSRELEPMAVASYVALIGTSDAIEPMRSMEELAEKLDLSHVSMSAARFDLGELKALNARFLHATPYAEVAERLAAKGIGGGEAFWLAVRGNVSVFDDVDAWWRVVDQEIAPVIENAEFLAKAAAVLPAEPWCEATWAEWTNAVKAATGAKGKALFHPLRLVLTAQESGPELKALLPLIGREKVLARLSGKTA
jgi:glutamyl-tRNA synthetase